MTVVSLVTTTVFGTETVTLGAYVRVTVFVALTIGCVVRVELLQPGVVSMQEQRVLTKEEACFWSEEKMGASLSSAVPRGWGLARGVMTGACCGQDVMVVETLLVSVTMTVDGVLNGWVSIGLRRWSLGARKIGLHRLRVDNGGSLACSHRNSGGNWCYTGCRQYRSSRRDGGREETCWPRNRIL
jgi:hypothetical protein